MTTFYTIIGFAPEPFSSIDIQRYGYGKVNTMKTLAAAKRRRTLIANKNKRLGVEFRILLTTIHADGAPSVEWVE